jgi:hypothetical protein
MANRRNGFKLVARAALIAAILFCFQTLAQANTRPLSTKNADYSKDYGVVSLSDVYSNMLNINRALTFYADQLQLKNNAKILELRPNIATDKTPEDIFEATKMLAQQLNQLSTAAGLTPIALTQHPKSNAISAEIYQASSLIMDQLIAVMHKKSLKATYGEFYTKHPFLINKTPNQVFALTTLAVRRMRLILEATHLKPARHFISNQP